MKASLKTPKKKVSDTSRNKTKKMVELDEDFFEEDYFMVIETEDVAY